MRRSLVTATTALLLLAGCGQGPSAGPVVGPAGGSPGPSASTGPGTPGPSSPASGAAARPTPVPREPLPAVPTTRATIPPAAAPAPAPARFRSSDVGIDLPVVPVGVAEDGQMQLPGTVREVGWYAYGSRPGEATGTTVLAAHVDTRAEGLGPFVRLRDLRRGDELTLTDARGRDHRYVVTAVADVEKAELALDQLFRRDGDPQLEVLTCGGPFSERTGYRDNLVVSARPR